MPTGWTPRNVRNAGIQNSLVAAELSGLFEDDIAVTALAHVSGFPLEVDREVIEDGAPRTAPAENAAAPSASESSGMGLIPEKVTVIKMANANASVAASSNDSSAAPANDMTARKERRIKCVSAILFNEELVPRELPQNGPVRITVANVRRRFGPASPLVLRLFLSKRKNPKMTLMNAPIGHFMNETHWLTTGKTECLMLEKGAWKVEWCANAALERIYERATLVEFFRWCCQCQWRVLRWETVDCAVHAGTMEYVIQCDLHTEEDFAVVQ